MTDFRDSHIWKNSKIKLYRRYMKALKEISNNKNIYITPFDKDGGINNYGYTHISTKNETPWKQHYIWPPPPKDIKNKWTQGHKRDKNLNMKSRNY